MRQRHQRILGYARVSSSEQAIGTSLHDQQEAISAYARTLGLKVASMYVEAESAVHEKIERREQMRMLLRDVREGDLVVCDKIDRWSRDPEFTYKSIREILAARASFFAVGDNCDPSTPDGDSTLNFRVMFAREEHKRIKQRMVGTRRILRDRGYYVDGLAPWGYSRQDSKTADRNILQANDDASTIRRVFRLCVEGRSLVEIGEVVGQTRDRVNDTIKNRVYLGEVRNTDGQWVKALHAPIIDARLYLAANAALTARRHGMRSRSEGVETADWWLRDLSVCALCGGKMSAAYGERRPDGRNYYYACFAKCTRRYVNVRAIEAAADPIVVARLVELREELAKAPRVARQLEKPVDLAERRERLQRKRERFLDAFGDGAMTRDELRERMAKLDQERTQLDAIEVIVPPVSTNQKRAALRDVAKLSGAWSRAPGVVRRQIVNRLAKSVRLQAGEPPVFGWTTGDDLARAEE